MEGKPNQTGIPLKVASTAAMHHTPSDHRWEGVNLGAGSQRGAKELNTVLDLVHLGDAAMQSPNLTDKLPDPLTYRSVEEFGVIRGPPNLPQQFGS